MRTDDEEALLTNFANRFYHGMRLRIDNWKPIMSDPEMLMPMMAILGHCTTMISEIERLAAINGQAVNAGRMVSTSAV